MSTRAQQARAKAERAQSALRRAAALPPHLNKNELQREGTGNSLKGRALHAATKLRADAKALKPNAGRVEGFFRTGNNGGEDQTVNGVRVGRGADGPADVHKDSRKSTRGSWAAGEKRASPLTHRAQCAAVTPAARATRGH
jgi:hypothetical protein